MLLAALCAACAPTRTTASGGEPAREPTERATIPVRTVAISAVAHVARVVDGDTLVIDEPVYGTTSVRLIGVDAPEVSHPAYGAQPHGREAAEFTASRLSVGSEVALELDARKTDQYGRLLAYVWLLDDGILFNELLVREGHAQAATFPPNTKYRDRLSAAQTEARESGRGLWTLPAWQLCQQTDRGNGIGGGCPRYP